MNFTDIFINSGYTNNKWLQRYLKFVQLFNTTESTNTHNHHILPSLPESPVVHGGDG